jgi:uncharacterized protein (DUF305 family)
MGAAMAVVMLSFMLGMYARKGANVAIYVLVMVIFAGSVTLLRSRATVGDLSWMRAMIPHHSIAILTSEHADLSNPRVRALADQIIEAQRIEIDEIKALIDDLTGGPQATPEVDEK